MVLQTHPVTVADLLRLPDGDRYELVRGELRPMSPTGEEPSRIAGNLAGSLWQHVTAQNLGAIYVAEGGFVIATQPDTVRAPDVAFVRAERLGGPPAKGYRAGAPDLAVEVISPNDSYTDVAEKVRDWLAAGTGLVIVVDPRKRTVLVYRTPTDFDMLTEADTLTGGAVVPGWTLPVQRLFP